MPGLALGLILVLGLILGLVLGFGLVLRTDHGPFPFLARDDP